MSTLPLVLQAIASLTGIATSSSMIIAYRQLRLASRNSQLSFEDALAREFRQVARHLPFRALLGGSIGEEELAAALPVFYLYFDLSDEQVFQRQHGRVSDPTWANWAEGIRGTMNRPAFAHALELILSQRPDAFSYLRRYMADNARSDPQRWPPTRGRTARTADHRETREAAARHEADAAATSA